MVRQRVDLLVLGSKELVTLDEPVGSDDLGIVDDGGVAVKAGRIVAAASSQLLERKFSTAKRFEVNDEIIMPGFVDPHTHLVFNGSREQEFQNRVAGIRYIEALKKGGGILETVDKTRQASRAGLVSEGRRRLDNCLEAGSTTVEMKSGYGLRTDTEVKILEAIRILTKTHPSRVIATFLGAHAIPREYSSSQEYTRLVIEEMLPIIFKKNLASFCDVFCEKGAFDAKESFNILRAAIRGGLKAKIHADQLSENGGTHVANTVGAVSADHLVFAPENELEKMVKTRAVPVVLPASSHSLLSEKRAKALEMLSIGLPVALGTDFSPANWVFGQLTVAALAARELGIRTADIIRGITINAARAVGMGGSVGSLSPGKWADLAILKVPNHKWIGYTYGEGVVDKVLIGGKVMVENGKRIH